MERITDEIGDFFSRQKDFFRYPLIFIAGGAISASELFGELSPLTPAFIGSLSGADCVFAFAGSLCAILLKGRFYEALPLLAALFILGAFRFFLAVRPGKALNIASSILSGISAGAVCFAYAAKPSEVIAAFVFGLSAGFLTYCLISTYRETAGGYMTALLKPSGTICPAVILIFVSAVLSGLTSAYELSVNVGILFGTVISLAFAARYKFSGGAVCGILAASGIALGATDLSAGLIVFALSSMGSGLFSRFGKITQSAGFILIMGIGVSALGINSNTLLTVASAASGSVLYILLPTGIIAGKIRYRQPVKNGADVSEIFAERLKLAGGAINDVKTAVEKAGEVLDKRNIKDVSWIYNSAGDSVCRRCGHNMLCWGEEYNDTVSSFNKMAGRLRKGDNLSESDLTPNIEKRCARKRELLYSLAERHREFTAVNTANRKMSEMRTVLTAQLGATEHLMYELSEEFRYYSRHDRIMAARVEQILAESGIIRPRVAVTIAEGRISIEGYGGGKLRRDGEQLCDLISAVLQREFDLPEIMNSSEGFRFTMYERAVYGVEYGVCQLSKSSEKSCGDYYESFVDGKGYAYIVLSDGMGSGSRARIDSAFACGMLVKLLRAGIGLPSAIDIINNSLLVKSSDESFATLDICRIDLYLGKVELFKAGAAPTYIRCAKKLVKAAGKGLPVGIGYRAVYESQSFTIGNGDMIIMASDGVELNEKWLERELLSKNFSDLNETAEHIAGASRFIIEDLDLRETSDNAPNNSDNASLKTREKTSLNAKGAKFREDDISVIAVKLVK